MQKSIRSSWDVLLSLQPMKVWFPLVFTAFAATQAFAQEAAEAVADAPVEELPPFVTIWQIATSGGWVMIPLGILSFIATMQILIFFFTIRQGAVVSRRYMETAEVLLKKGDYLGLLAVSNRNGSSVARVLQRAMDFALRHKHSDFRLVREVAEAEGLRQASLLNTRISYLADVGAIAPMVGLLGTVIGMIQSFSVLASDIAASRPMLLADGVSVALVTTATGLLIGIPALAFYAYFRGKVSKMIADLEGAATHLVALLAIEFEKGLTPSNTSKKDLSAFDDDLI